MLTALEYLGSVGIGVTSPQLFRADDDQVYVVKLQNNPMGTKVLVNEYLACWFGQCMGLCFPPGDLLEISEALLLRSPRLRAGKVKARLHFASQYLYKNRYVGKDDLKKAVNKQGLAGVMLFDHMFHNVDRAKNRRNLLICREEAEDVLYAIDNSHLFVRGRWNLDSLERLSNKIVTNRWRAYGWLLTHFLVPQDFTSYVEKVKAIREEDLALLVANIPQDWLPLITEREALLRYMVIRCKRIDEIVEALYQLIPDINRRSYFH